MTLASIIVTMVHVVGCVCGLVADTIQATKSDGVNRM